MTAQRGYHHDRILACVDELHLGQHHVPPHVAPVAVSFEHPSPPLIDRAIGQFRHVLANAFLRVVGKRCL